MKPTIFSYLNSYDGIVKPVVPPVSAVFSRVSPVFESGLFGLNAISCPQNCDPTTDIRFESFTFTNKGTLEMWFKPTWGWNGTASTDGSKHVPFSTEYGGSDFGFTFLNFHHGECMYWDLYNPTSRVSVYSVTFSAGDWVHLAVTWDGTAGSNQQKIYVNNVLVGQASGWNGSGTSTRNLLVGSGAFNGAPRTEGINALMQNFKYYQDYVKSDFSDRFQMRSGMNDQRLVL